MTSSLYIFDTFKAHFGNFYNLSPLKIQSQVFENEFARLHPELFWKNYFFSPKFGQKHIRIPPVPYLKCANLDRNFGNLDQFPARLKWMTTFFNSYYKNDIILNNHPSPWCNMAKPSVQRSRRGRDTKIRPAKSNMVCNHGSPLPH